MSDTSASGSGTSDTATDEKSSVETERRKQLFFRLLYMLAFWFLGNIAFSLSILLGFVQFAVQLITGEENRELKRFARNLSRYVWHCLAFVNFEREDKPFPLGPFPSVDDAGGGVPTESR